MARLRSSAADESELIDFIDGSFEGQFAEASRQARCEMVEAGLDFVAALPSAQRTLAPSDFGFHNTLRYANGALAFVDFEYFGWDDPAKLTADIMLHPGRPLSAPQRQRFSDGRDKTLWR